LAGAKPGAGSPEPVGVHPTSDTAPACDLAASDAAARMEQVIAQFIRQDHQDEDAAATVAADKAVDDDVRGIVAQLAPRRLDGAVRLTRFVAALRPADSTPVPSDDRWRRQFISALHDADDGVPMAPVSPPPVDDRRERPVRRRPHVEADPSPPKTGWQTARRILVAAVTTTCVFSTGVIWATHRAEIKTDTGSQAAETAVLRPNAAVEAGGQPIRNTPVLIREGEALAFTPGFAAPGWRQGPPAPEPSTVPASAPAPIFPRIINVREQPQPAPVAPDSAAALPSAQATAPVEPQPLLDRDGMTALAKRATEVRDDAPPPPAATETPRREAAIGQVSGSHEPLAFAAPKGRVSSVPFQAREIVPSAPLSRIPAASGWEGRRQSLRTEPEPEPSAVKKLIGIVWPFGKASTTAEPVKPATPTVTAPAYSWSDSAHPNP